MSTFEPHLRVLASAGSGKTFRLVERYIALLRGGVLAQRILATTFTRAAAGEIQQRVLRRLFELSEACEAGSADSREMRTLLRQTARNLHHLRIRTLDSFFASVVRAFAFELGVSPTMTVADEVQAAALRREAIRIALSESDSGMVQTLRNLMMGRLSAGIARNVEQVLMTLDELASDAPDEAWEMIPMLPVLEDAEVDAAVAALASVDPEFLFGSDKRFHKAWLGDVERARTRDWKAFVAKGLAKPILLDAAAYFSKPIPPEAIDLYYPLVLHARASLLNIRCRQNRATRELLGSFRAALQTLKRRRGVLFFSDFTELMQEALSPERSSQDIGYRLDGAIEHVLLDEFQDTSSAQWRALTPLLLELVGDETRSRSTFVVGDLKQSIYGWRGGEAEILNHLPNLLVPGFEDRAADDHPVFQTQRMNVSWRSSPIILQAVDHVFAGVEENAAVGEQKDAAVEFASWYQSHQAHHADLPGYAELTVVEARSTKSATRWARMQEAAACIGDLHARAPQRTIGVLMRTGRGAAMVLHALRALAPDLDVAGDVDAPVTDSAAAAALLDMLRLIDQPADCIAAMNIGSSPLGVWLGIGPLSSTRERGLLAARLRTRLAQRGLAALLAEAAQAINASGSPRDRKRIEHLLQMAERDDMQRVAGLREFVENAESKRIREVVDHPVRVMTMHRAKGLEFDAVVLPEMDGSLRGIAKEVVAIGRERDIGEVTGICRWIDAQQLPLMPASVRDLHEARHHRAVRESLCLLYVALTRARTRLHLFVDEPGKSFGSSSRVDHLLLGQLCGEEIPSGRAWCIGDEDAWDRSAEQTKAAPSPPRATVRPKQPLRIGRASGVRPTARAALSASALAHTEDRLSARLFLGDRSAAWFGTVVHRLFEEVVWADESLPDAAQLRAAAAHAVRSLARDLRGVDGSALAEEAVACATFCLSAEEVRRALSRPAQANATASTAQVIHEWPFVRRAESGRLQQGFIDRLVIERDATGRPLRSTITDYKTDRIAPDDPTALRAAVEGHAPQMQTYRSVVAERYTLKPEDVGVQLLFVRLARVEMV